MDSKNINIINRLIFNKDAILSIIIPAFIYGLTYRYFGLVEAVIVSGGYAVVASFFLQSTKYIAFVFAIFGLIEICIVWLLPANWLIETLFIKSFVGAIQTSLVFLLFTLINKPIPKLFAEIASPRLKEWHFSSTPEYFKIWQKLSYIWIAVYLLKALILFSFYPMTANELVMMNLFLGWPVHIGLIVFSVCYVRNLFAKYTTD